MGLRDLIFGKEEEDEDATSAELHEDAPAKERPVDGNIRFGESETPRKPPVKPVQERPVAPEVPVSSPDLEAELKELQNLMQAEKKEKGLGQEYYGFLKALGEEDDDEAHQRTLRSVNAVREQFSIGQALNWKSLIESAKSCMAWLSNHSRQKNTKLQEDHRAAVGNIVLQIEKAGMAIQESEEKIQRLQRAIEEQKAIQEAAKQSKQKAELEFEKKKVAIDNASIQLATDIANDIAVFQRQQ